MHYSFVITPPPPGEGGDSRGNERGFDQSFATAVRGIYPGFVLYRQKGLEMKRWQAAGETAVVLPTSSPRRQGLLAGIC